MNDNYSGESIVVNDVENEPTLVVYLLNLIPNTKYHVSVVAYTSVGPGEAANLSVTTTFSEKKNSTYVL